MQEIQFSFKLSSTDPDTPLGLEAWIDGTKFFDCDHVRESTVVSTQLSDDEAEHVLRLIMKNKTSDHTKIDQAGGIISDARLIVENVAFDDIDLGYTLTKLASYTHDFNGTGSEHTQQFYGELGCNGTVRLEFSTPIYLWLLEHS